MWPFKFNPDADDKELSAYTMGIFLNDNYDRYSRVYNSGEKFKGQVGGFSKIVEEFYESLDEYLHKDWEKLKDELIDLHGAVENCLEEMYGLNPKRIAALSRIKQIKRMLEKEDKVK